MNKLRIVWFLGILLCIGVLSVFAQGGTEPPQAPDAAAGADAGLLQLLEAAVEDVPGIRQVVEVSFITEGRDASAPGTLSVVYITREMDEIGYRAETLDVFYTVGRILMAQGADVGQVVLSPSVSSSSAIERILTQMDDLQSLLDEDLTRTDFLTLMQILPGNHQIPGHNRGGSDL